MQTLVSANSQADSSDRRTCNRPYMNWQSLPDDADVTQRTRLQEDVLCELDDDVRVWARLSLVCKAFRHELRGKSSPVVRPLCTTSRSQNVMGLTYPVQKSAAGMFNYVYA